MSLPPHRVDYSPIIDRPRLTWPQQARVAFWVAPNVEHYEYLPDYAGHRNPWPRMAYPDARDYSYRDYGNRVGFWRMLEVLDAYAIKCCVSLNLAVLEHYPEIASKTIFRLRSIRSPWRLALNVPPDGWDRNTANRHAPPTSWLRLASTMCATG